MGTTLHETHTVWDHSIAPIHEVEPGTTVELEVVNASGGTVQEASALVSVACDLRIHEVVDVPNWVVGCFVPDARFEGVA